jgi:predicted kinase
LRRSFRVDQADQGLLENPGRLSSSQSAGAIMEAVELVVLCGLQASGKSTFSRVHLPNHVVVSKDMMSNNKHKERRQSRLIAQSLGEGRDVVVDNTNPSVEERASIISLGRVHGARIVGYFFESVVADCIRRNGSRSARESVPAVAIYSTIARLRVPTMAEGFDQLNHVQVGNDGEFVVSPWTSESTTDG